MTTAEVTLWGTPLGAVSLPDGDRFATFEYFPEFVERGVEVSPLTMPLGSTIYRFPALDTASFSGLPGLLADSLPDRYGNALIDAWLAGQGRRPGSFDPVERLCYVGRRGMGALEFRPMRGPEPAVSNEIHVAELARLAARVLAGRGELETSLNEKSRAMREILRVGTSAGGARAKALVALNSETMELRSGQIGAGPGFEYWILKFDGVGDDSRDLGSSHGYGAIEYAYSRMAAAAGVAMSECRLLEEGERRHFMTKRFDRDPDGSKIHMQSLAGLRHLDFRQPGANSYEQAFMAIRDLNMDRGRDALEQQVRRMIFNVVARNQDDHVKNIAFLMDRQGRWSLAPAFDVVYAYNPSGDWTAMHQMSINGRRDEFTMSDVRRAGEAATLKRGRVDEVFAEVSSAVGRWPELAAEAGVPDERVQEIRETHRLTLPAG